MELQGKIERIEQEKQVTDSFKKREFVIATDLDTEYPQYIALECVQDKCSLLDSYAVGTDVTAYINVRGRNWTSPKGELRTFNTLQVWRIENLSADKPIPAEPNPVAETIQQARNVKLEDQEPDDLPF